MVNVLGHCELDVSLCHITMMLMTMMTTTMKLKMMTQMMFQYVTKSAYIATSTFGIQNI